MQNRTQRILVSFLTIVVVPVKVSHRHHHHHHHRRRHRRRHHHHHRQQHRHHQYLVVMKTKQVQVAIITLVRRVANITGTRKVVDTTVVRKVDIIACSQCQPTNLLSHHRHHRRHHQHRHHQYLVVMKAKLAQVVIIMAERRVRSDTTMGRKVVTMVARRMDITVCFQCQRMIFHRLPIIFLPRPHASRQQTAPLL